MRWSRRLETWLMTLMVVATSTLAIVDARADEPGAVGSSAELTAEAQAEAILVSKKEKEAQEEVPAQGNHIFNDVTGLATAVADMLAEVVGTPATPTPQETSALQAITRLRTLAAELHNLRDDMKPSRDPNEKPKPGPFRSTKLGGDSKNATAYREYKDQIKALVKQMLEWNYDEAGTKLEVLESQVAAKTEDLEALKAHENNKKKGTVPVVPRNPKEDPFGHWYHATKLKLKETILQIRTATLAVVQVYIAR